jgi:hypothetical protein
MSPVTAGGSRTDPRTAETGCEAELRVLAVIDHDYEDDLPRCGAEVVSNGAGTWTVRVTFRDRR